LSLTKQNNTIILYSIGIYIITANFSFGQLEFQNAFPNLSFNDPLDLQNSGDGTNRIFVVERAGRIKVFPNSSSVTSLKTYLDITDSVSAGGEMGLLGLAFHPDYKNNGYFYVNYTVSNPLKTRISRFQISAANPDSADKNSELILLTFSQPFENHNGGWVGFGPDDGYLYIGTGDGGSGGDPQNNGQSIVTFLGKILRIDIDNQDPGLEYAIPDDNPFVDSTGSVVKEIYAWGMRNPWRNSFDPVTGWLWSADVGQNQWEEIDIIENGKNYGWRCREGAHPFNTNGCNYPEYIDPIWEYSHSLGCSVTGGYVYRGPTVPELTGKYIYADYCTRTVWSLEYDGFSPPDNQTLLTSPGSVTSFGVDENQELYWTSFDGNIYKFSPTINGQFITNISQPTYSVTIAVDMQNGTGTAGEVSLEFTYNTDDLLFPSTPVKNTDYLLYGDFDTYSLQDVTRPSPNSIRISLETTGTPAPVPLSTTPTNIITLYFTILDQQGTSNLVWVTTEIAPALLQQNYTIGNWPNVNDNPLPVELTSFTAEANGNKVDLSWETATEINNYGFDVERRINEGEWISIAFIEGHGTSNSPKEYSYSDKDLFAGGSKFQYRLKQIDNDGSFEYSDVVEVEIVVNQYELSQNYPNPFNPSTTISFSLPESGKVILKIYNLMGEEIKTLVDGFKDAGIYKVNFNAEELASGMYLYILSTNGFTATKKMLFMK